MTVLFTFLKVSCKLYFTSFEIDLIVIISVTFPNEGFSLIPINAIVSETEFISICQILC